MSVEHLDVYISGTKDSGNRVTCWCSNWVDNHWEIQVEFTQVLPSERNTILDNIVPGAYTMQYNVLGDKHFVDTTYAYGNTLIISPVSGTNLYDMYDEVTIAVTSWEDGFLNRDYQYIKIEGVVLD